MNERPIIFCTESIRAILEGKKTQTRRVIKPQPPHWTWNDHSWDERCIDVGTGEREDAYYVICPYGKPGNRLWVVEKWRCEELASGADGIRYEADRSFIGIQETLQAANKWIEAYQEGMHYRPSIFMPRWVSRITLEIVKIRVEHLQEISAGDCEAEGMKRPRSFHLFGAVGKEIDEIYRVEYQFIWNSINAKRGFPWDSNPWVWVIEFQRVDEKSTSST